MGSSVLSFLRCCSPPQLCQEQQGRQATADEDHIIRSSWHRPNSIQSEIAQSARCERQELSGQERRYSCRTRRQTTVSPLGSNSSELFRERPSTCPSPMFSQ